MQGFLIISEVMSMHQGIMAPDSIVQRKLPVIVATNTSLGKGSLTFPTWPRTSGKLEIQLREAKSMELVADEFYLKSKFLIYNQTRSMGSLSLLKPKPNRNILWSPGHHRVAQRSQCRAEYSGANSWQHPPTPPGPWYLWTERTPKSNGGGRWNISLRSNPGSWRDS